MAQLFASRSLAAGIQYFFLFYGANNLSIHCTITDKAKECGARYAGSQHWFPLANHFHPPSYHAVQEKHLPAS